VKSRHALAILLQEDGDMIRGRNARGMFVALREQIEHYFRQFLGATITHDVVTYGEEDNDGPWGENWDGDAVGTTKGDVGFIDIVTLEPENSPTKSMQIVGITVDLNWDDNMLGTAVNVSFLLSSDVTITGHTWDQFDSDDVTFMGKPLHQDFHSNGEVIGGSVEGFTTSLSGLLKKEREEAEGEYGGPIEIS
jgi:hypothetical protein